MKKSFTILSLLLIFLFAAMAFAGAFIKQFNARSEGDGVRVEWQTGEETDMDKFFIQRETPQTNFVDIASINPKGSNSFYTYLDEAILKPGDFIFSYRLKITDRNGNTSYSNKITVSPNVSGVKRTWGSIKAMFR